MANNIPRKDPYLNEAIDILDQHLKRCKFDKAVAFNTLSSVYGDFVNEEIGRCMVNPRYYLENYHVVKTKNDGFKTLYPFWDSQEIIYSEIMGLLAQGKAAKILVDKARQLGSSTLSEGIIYQRTIFSEATNTLIVAQDPGQADYLFSMSVRAFENIPWWMQPQLRYHSKGRYMVFDSEIPGMIGLNSEIFVEAANKLSGVSVGKTIHSAHLSELSSWDNAKILTEQIFPAMSGNNVIAILESTARGRSGFWYDFWCEAIDNWGEEDWEWKPVFVEWFRCREYSVPIENKAGFALTDEETAIRSKVKQSANFYIPDEQFNWRRIKRKETIKITGDDTSFLQEYCQTWQESFQTSGLCAFPKKLLQEIMNTTCCDPLWYGEITYNHGAAQEIRTHLTPTFDEAEKGRTGNVVYRRDRVIPPAKKYGGRFRVWEQPEAGEAYYVAGDPAHGLEGGDFSCAEIFRIGHGCEPDVQVAEWHGWINPSGFGHILVALAKWYNGAELSLELNAVGELTYMVVFRTLEYSNLFRWKHYDKVKNYWSDYMAWLTTSKTRDLIISNMRERIMEKTVTLYSYDLLDQMMDFSSEEEGSKFEGQNTNDDRIFASMICLWCAHDSDYGKAAAMAPKSGEAGPKKFYVIDNLNRIVHTCEQKEEAYSVAYVKSDVRNVKGEPIDTHAVMRPGWSIAQKPTRKDFNNSDFSPVHDKPGPRQTMHYAFGIPAESIRLDNIDEALVMKQSQDREWMEI